MKKIIAVLLLAALLFSFAGCASENETDEKDKENEVKYTGELKGPFFPSGSENGYLVGIDDSFIYLYKDSDREHVFQYYSVSGFDDTAYSLSGVRSEDINFDGFSDLVIPFRRVDDLQYYYAYLWDGEKGNYSLCADVMGIGEFTVCDGWIEGKEYFNGELITVKYMWEGSELESEAETDRIAALALDIAKGLTGKDGLSVTYTRDDLTDLTLTRLYTVSEGAKSIAYVAINYDMTRFFWSEMSEVFFEVSLDENGKLIKTQSYSKMKYDGVPYGFSEEEYGKLSSTEQNYYDMIREKLLAFENISYESAEAVTAYKALIKDHPIFSNYFNGEVMGNTLTGSYFYQWSTYSEEISPDVISEKLEEYRNLIFSYVESMPLGLEPIERYVFLAQKLQHECAEEHEHTVKDGFGIQISGDTSGEQIAKTFAYMCELAELYCTWDGGYNMIMAGTELTKIDLYESSRCEAGSDEWLSAFYAED